ncbi:unnamed protein product [Brugia timori]|uniref:Zf-C3H1 domain-containing protein n=1 Tax=Brugia timori TaxID=42155 RepID=A0A0R3Q8D7_9BILA|nr:unnamed protein product [Brugia timori]
MGTPEDRSSRRNSEQFDYQDLFEDPDYSYSEESCSDASVDSSTQRRSSRRLKRRTTNSSKSPTNSKIRSRSPSRQRKPSSTPKSSGGTYVKDGIKYSKRGDAYLPGETDKEFHRRRTREGMGALNTSTDAIFKVPSVTLPTASQNAASVVASIEPSIAPPLTNSADPASSVDITTLQSQIRRLQTALEEERRQRRVIAAKVALLETDNARLRANAANNSLPVPTLITPPSVPTGTVAAVTASLPGAASLPPPSELESLLTKIVCKVFGVALPSAQDNQQSDSRKQRNPSASRKAPKNVVSSNQPQIAPASSASVNSAIPGNKDTKRKRPSQQGIQNKGVAGNSVHLSSPAPLATPTYADISRLNSTGPTLLTAPAFSSSAAARSTLDGDFQTVSSKRKRTQRSPNQLAGTLPSPSAASTPAPLAPRHRPNSLLVLPVDSGTKALFLMQQAKLSPRAFNILHHTEFPSGAVLLVCGSAAKVEELRAAVAHIAGLRLKTETKLGYSFRVHFIPEETTEDDFVEDFGKRFPQAPVTVKFVPYWAPKAGSRQVGAKLAVCEVDADTFKTAEAVRSLRVGWSTCPLDTKPYVNRCSHCHLLGHNKNHCSAATTTEAPALAAPADPSSSSVECRDCLHFNATILAANLGRHRLRAVGHPTGHSSCVTYRRLLGKKLPVPSPTDTVPEPLINFEAEQPMEEGLPLSS